METKQYKPFIISFNVNEEFNWYEKNKIMEMLYEYYEKKPGFYELMNTEYNQVCVTKPTHLSDGDDCPHFNVYLFNNFKNIYKPRTAKRISYTFHVYTNYVRILRMTEINVNTI